jgi:hypothetical protein
VLDKSSKKIHGKANCKSCGGYAKVSFDKSGERASRAVYKTSYFFLRKDGHFGVLLIRVREQHRDYVCKLKKGKNKNGFL